MKTSVRMFLYSNAGITAKLIVHIAVCSHIPFVCAASKTVPRSEVMPTVLYRRWCEVQRMVF